MKAAEDLLKTVVSYHPEALKDQQRKEER